MALTLLTIKWASSKRDPKNYHDFVQGMANRLIQGFFRYGRSTKEQKYMQRMTLELQAYKRTGNYEHLMNLANYALLESEAPENKKFHYNAYVESATRGKSGTGGHKG